MKSKFVFLKDLDAAVGFTSSLMTQEFEVSTTIVPQISVTDYFKVRRFAISGFTTKPLVVA